MQTRQLRQDQTALLWASLLTLACWFVPILNWIALPLEYLNAHTHEMCHAIVAVLTGGQVQQITVFADGSGVTPVVGGILPLVASAGYVGASIIGVLIILFSRTPEGARWSIRALAFALTASMIVWVRGTTVGVVSGIGWILLLFVLASLLPKKSVLFAAMFLGVQQCLHSVLALLTLMDISMFTRGHSDASIMQAATGLPATFWAIGWSLFSVLLMGIALRGSFKAAGSVELER